MSYNDGHRCRRYTRPSFSNRTLHHPSFMPMYMAAAFTRHRIDWSDQTVLPIIPSEFFYSDPTMSCGRRIPNIVSELRVFDCFQLSTPPPIMSTCPTPPIHQDPFRSAPHPTRDLGSLGFKMNTLHHPMQPRQAVLQLTQEEDQAITNLLKLHHQEPVHSDETLTALQMDFSAIDLNPIPFLHPELMDTTSSEDVHEPSCSDVQYPREASLQSRLQQGRWWSHTELEAANTLLNCFSLMETDNILGQDHNKAAVRNYDSSISSDIQQGSEAFPALLTSDCAPNDSDSKPKSASGDFSEVKKTLSDSEGVAVHVLLNLGNTGASDIVQTLGSSCPWVSF